MCIRDSKYRMKRTSWTTGKFTVKIVDLTNSLSDDEYLLTALFLDEKHEMPNDVNCARLHTLGLNFFSVDFYPKVSFEKFSNLNSLLLKYAPFNDCIIPIFSMLDVYKRQQKSN